MKHSDGSDDQPGSFHLLPPLLFRMLVVQDSRDLCAQHVPTLNTRTPAVVCDDLCYVGGEARDEVGGEVGGEL